MAEKIKQSIPISLFMLILIHLVVPEGLPAQEITLRYGYTTGTVLNYTLTLDTPNPQGSRKVNLKLTQEVISAGLDILETETSFTNGTMMVNGISYPFPLEGPILSSKMQRNGLAIENTALGQYKDLLAKAGFASFTSVTKDVFRALGVLEFPTTPVSVGSTWSVPKNHTLPNGDSLSITYGYTFESLVNYGGYNCARIRIEAQPTFSFYQDFPSLRRGMHTNGTLKVAGTLLFAYTEGKIVKLDNTNESNTVGTTITYEGTATVIPSYQKTTVALELQ